MKGAIIMLSTKRLLSLFFVVFVGLACGDDGAGVVTTSDTEGGTGGTGGSPPTTSTTTTSTDTGDPESDGVGPCKPVVSNAGALTPAAFHGPHPVDLAEVCNDDLLGATGIAQVAPLSANDVLQVQNPANPDPENDNFDVLVYAPETETPLPEPLPIVVFAPGNNQVSYDEGEEQELYAHIAGPLVEDGYIAMFINPRAINLHSGKRWRMQLCTLVWAATPSGAGGWNPPRDSQGTPLYQSNGMVVLGGHSRGAGGSLLFADQFEGFTQSVSLMQDYQLCGGVAIAPNWTPGSGLSDATSTNITLPNDKAVPWLTFSGAYDEDTTGQGLKHFDSVVPEDPLTLSRSSACGGPSSPAGCAAFNTWDKVHVLGYGITHNSWGGTDRPDDNTTPQSRERGRAVGPELVRRFLRWQMMGIDVQDSRDLFALLMDPDATNADFPAGLDLADPSLWATHPQYEQLPMNGKRPLVFASYSPGIGTANAERIVVDTLARSGSMMCGGDGAGRPADFLSPSLFGGDVLVTGLGVSGGVASDQVCQGMAEDLGLGVVAHETQVLRVQYGGSVSDPGGAIRWDFMDNPLDASGAAYLNVRMGTLHPSVGCMQADNLAGIELEIETQDSNMVVLPFDRPSGPQLAQQARLPPMEDGMVCMDGASQAMVQYRFALSDFCPVGTPMNMSEITGITIRFPAGQEDPQGVLIDSLELTRSSLEPEGAGCPAFASAWNCPATGRLLVRETSCAGEPTPACASGDVVLTTVAKPWVENPDGGGFEGWVVHVPNIADPLAPSSSELAYVEARCAQACALEYSDRPDIAASCTHALAWDPPTLRGIPSLPTVRRIPLDRRDGSGVFTGLSLSSDLLVDACQAFDEDLCAATPARVTPAQLQPSGAPLARGEEWRVQLAGASELVLATPGDSGAAPLSGTAGWSACADFGSGSTDCPFYLGSLELETLGSIGLSDQCPDSSMFAATVSAFSLTAFQPAFGIADALGSRAGFPPGGLVLEARMTIGGVEHLVRGVNDDDVVMDLDAGALEGHASFGFDVPCGAGTLAVVAEIAWETTSIEDAPPTVELTMPSHVTCDGSNVALSANASDPDGDLDSVRFFVDGVLVAPLTTQIPFTGPHMVRAVARDERGATSSDEQLVACCEGVGDPCSDDEGCCGALICSFQNVCGIPMPP